MPMPCEDDLGDMSHLPENVQAGKALLQQYRVAKWKAERSGAHQSITTRLNARILELEDALAGVELEAEDCRADLAESCEARDALAANLDAERAAHAVQVALHAEEVKATTVLTRAVVTKEVSRDFQLVAARDVEAAIERELELSRLGDAALRMRRQRDGARTAYADALIASEASEKCVASLVNEVRTMARAVDAQSAASDALATSAESATARAERAERRAAAADGRRIEAEEEAKRCRDHAMRVERDALLACDHAARGLSDCANSQLEVVRLQSLLAESYRDLERALKRGADVADDDIIPAEKARCLEGDASVVDAYTATTRSEDLSRGTTGANDDRAVEASTAVIEALRCEHERATSEAARASRAALDVLALTLSGEKEDALRASAASFEASRDVGAQSVADVAASSAAAFAAMAAEVERGDERHDELFQRFIDSEAAARANLSRAVDEGRRAKDEVAQLRDELKLEQSATDELMSTLEEKEAAFAELSERARLEKARFDETELTSAAALAAARDAEQTALLDLQAANDRNDGMRKELEKTKLIEPGPSSEELLLAAQTACAAAVDDRLVVALSIEMRADRAEAELAVSEAMLETLRRERVEHRRALNEAAMAALAHAKSTNGTNGEHQRLEARIAEAEKVAAYAKAELLALESKLEDAERLAEAANGERDDLQTKLQNAEQQARALMSGERDDLQTKLEDAEREMAVVTNMRDELETKLDDAVREASVVTTERDDLATKLQDAERHAVAVMNERDERVKKFQDAERQAAAMTTERNELAKELENADRQATAFAIERNELVSKLEGAVRQTTMVTTERDVLATKLEDAQRQATAVTTERNQLATKLEDAERKTMIVTTERDELVTKLEDAGQQVSSVATERDNLATMLEDAEHHATAVATERDELAIKLEDSERKAAVVTKLDDDAERVVATERDELQTNLKDAERHVVALSTERDELKSNLEDAERRVMTVAFERDELATKLEYAECQVTTVAIKRDELAKKVEDAECQATTVTTKRDELAQKLEDAERQAEAATDERDELFTKLDDAERQAVAVANERDELKKAVAGVTNERDELQIKLCDTATAAEQAAHIAAADRRELHSLLEDARASLELTTHVSSSESQALTSTLHEARAECRELETKLEAARAEVEGVARATEAERKEFHAMLEESRATANKAVTECRELHARLQEAEADAIAQLTNAEAAATAIADVSVAERHIVDATRSTEREELLRKLHDAEAATQAATSDCRELEAKLKETLASATTAAETANAELEELRAKLSEAEASTTETAEAARAEVGDLRAKLDEMNAVATSAAEVADAELDELRAKLNEANTAVAAVAKAAEVDIGDLRAKLRDAEAAANADYLGLESRCLEAESALAKATRSAYTERQALLDRLQHAMATATTCTTNGSMSFAVECETTATKAVDGVRRELAAAQNVTERLRADLDVLSVPRAVVVAASSATIDQEKSVEALEVYLRASSLGVRAAKAEAGAAEASVNSLRAYREAFAASMAASSRAERVDLQLECAKYRACSISLDARLAEACASNAANTNQLATEAELLRTALDTVKSEREALRTDTDLLQQALDHLKAENVDLKRLRHTQRNGSSLKDQVIAEVDDDEVEALEENTHRQVAATPMTHNGSAMSSLTTGAAPASPAAIEQLRSMAAACEDKIRVHVEAAADSIAIAFTKEYEKRDELKRAVVRYREERDSARFERDAERRRADAAAQAAEEALVKAGSQRDEALERAAAAEDELALQRGFGQDCLTDDSFIRTLTTTLSTCKDSLVDPSAVDALLADLSSSSAQATDERRRIERALVTAVRERDDAVAMHRTDVARIAEAEAHAARVEAARAEALQAAAERRAALIESSNHADELRVRDDKIDTLRRDVHEATRAKVVAEKAAKKSAQRMRDLEQRLERDASRCERLEAHAADLLSQLAHAERARAALAASKHDVVDENQPSSSQLKKINNSESKSFRDELRTLRLENIELRSHRDELVDDVAHLKSELSRTRLVLMGLEHYSNASSSAGTLATTATL